MKLRRRHRAQSHRRDDPTLNLRREQWRVSQLITQATVIDATIPFHFTPMRSRRALGDHEECV